MRKITKNSITEERQKLVEENHNLIYHMCRKYNLSIEEYYDILAIALCKAAIAYDKNTGYSFATYACKSMFNAYLAHIRYTKSSRRNGVTISLNDIIYENSNGDSDIVLEDIISNNLDAYDECIFLDFSKLDERQRKIIELRMQGYNQIEIADLFNISQATVTRTLSKIHKLLTDDDSK